MAESRLDKIIKCLELAKSSNKYEAESAMKMAQRLALKEGISLDDVKKEESRDVIERDLDLGTRTVSGWRAELAAVISKNFRTTAVKVIQCGESGLRIVGLKEDVEITCKMFEYAEVCMDKFFKRYLKELKADGKVKSRADSMRYRNIYFSGYLKGLDKAFEKNVEEFGLMVVKPDELVKYEESQHYRKGRASERVSMNDLQAFARGQDDGKAVGSRDRIE